tara:strand:+ start:107 stop:577 length:471 start_codon:yes stop_codon:yes gene_type:complete
MICEVCKIDFDKLCAKNKCKKCYDKQSNIINKERKKQYNKQYNIDNKEHIREKRKKYAPIYYQTNKEKLKQYSLSEIGIKSRIIVGWKRNGLIELEGVYTYESLYEYYLSISHCEVCETKFKDSYDKCMDHCHETNIFRWVLCRSCNNNDKWMSYF